MASQFKKGKVFFMYKGVIIFNKLLKIIKKKYASAVNYAAHH